ncbi:MAG: adenylate/guanylate cyclase domain-containing protein [Deltaproteobacteria bacterium]|nr:adenylate/guanylate cyclase domain-containing protein [Deltaproteobacteria bacterium]
MTTPPIRRWFLLGFVITFAANAIAVVFTQHTFDAMGGVSSFARAVRVHDMVITDYVNLIAFPGVSLMAITYLWPVLAYLRGGNSVPTIAVQRRILSTPLFIALAGFVPWTVGGVVFPLLTLQHFGHWSPELASQEILSPLVSGFIAATISYLLLDWLVRARIATQIFRDGSLADVPGTMTLGVRSRLFVFLIAVAFLPLFTMFGLVRAAVVRLDAGLPPNTVVPILAHAAELTFGLYVVLGLVLTWLFGRTLARPLVEVAATLRQIHSGDLSHVVAVTSNDEVGVVQDGVNTMIAALRDREHILQTFGRVVEPTVRDQLLRGEIALGGDLRTVSVLFCDLRGFTAFAERTPPTEVVATLNDLFTTLTAWVRTCGGYVDKFIGDAMLVVFGLFDRRDETDPAATAADAVRCALGMHDRLKELNAGRSDAPLQVAVSVHTGEVLAGRIGAADRHDYTVIGDTVNVAARLQQFCKEL